MNKITAFVNNLNEAFEPLHDFAQDEAFRGEVLASVGAKEKNSPDDKAKTQEKLTGLVKKLDDLRNWLGLDKSDIPKVDNITGVVLMLQEVRLLFDSLGSILESCDFEDSTDDADGRQIKIANAVRALSKLLTFLFLKKKYPGLAAFFEALGIFSDELNETKRALYLTSTADIFRPTGDLETDVRQRISKAIFIDASVLIEILFKKEFFKGREEGEIHSLVDEMGNFLFNFGWELPPEKDTFKHANRFASRVLQLHYVPGTFLRDLSAENLGDVLISFASVPVMPSGGDGTAAPLGFQYILKFESDLDDIFPGGDKFGGFKFAMPAKPNVSMIWGHETNFKLFSGDSFGAAPLLEMLLPGEKKETNPANPVTRDASSAESNADEANSVRRGEIGLITQTQKTGDKEDINVRLDFRDFNLILSGDGRDGFIQKILPDGNLTINANVSVTYSSQNGFSVDGLDDRDGLFFQINVNKTFFGALEIPTVYVGLRPALEKDETTGQQNVNGLNLEASALLKLELGPFRLAVDRLGLSLTLDFPDDASGNLGGANLDLGLKPPTGIGFVIEAKAVRGGGFLSIDPEKGQYSGAAELTILDKISLKAIAVILTKRPDGSKGFSFLLIVSLEFSPGYELFPGVRLKGVGGLVAIHRSIDLDAFRDGVRDERFDSILFPDNPVGNAPTIVSQMTTLFPFGESHYAFGLMGRLEWGTSRLVDMKLGLLIDITNRKGEWPRASSFAIVGVIKVSVEKGELKIIRFKLNFLVAFDFEKKMLSIDAALYDSKFVKFDVQGRFYLRVIWGDQPCFLASVGGWHPDFQPPAVLRLPAKPDRLAIPLMDKSAIKLKLSVYVALSSNSFQFGAAVELKVKVSKFRLEAGLSLDALFRSLTEFLVNFEGKLHIYWGSHHLAGISVKGALSGTQPWRIRGSASFSIWIWDYDVDFDHSTGSDIPEIPQSVDVLPLLEAALQDTRNWRAVLPTDRPLHVLQRSVEKDEVEADSESVQPLRADPLARLDVVQQVTPLGIRIDKIGYERVRDFRKFDLQPLDESSLTADDATVEDFFAPGMFLDLNDAEKLSRKSFEQMAAGRSFSNFETVAAGIPCQDEFAYEDLFIDSEEFTPTAEKPSVSSITPERFQQLVGRNSVGRSASGRKAAVRQEALARRGIVRKEEFVLVDADSGKKIEDIPARKSMTVAYYEQWKVLKANPLRKTIVVRRSDSQ